MRTKLGLFCDRVLEAGWLLAIVLIPLYFNAYSSRTFEPDKLYILRSLALIVTCTWIIKLIENGFRFAGKGSTPSVPHQEPDRGWWRTLIVSSPFALPVVLFFFAYLMSTLLSVLPEASVGGSYTRLQGTFTMFSYMVIFFTMAAVLRNQDQLDRLLDAIILTTIPIALYGILQHYDLDFMGWSQDMKDRPGANMGNPIFFAAYLIMVIPVTLYRIAAVSYTHLTLPTIYSV
jgi:hypothetical protein